MARRLFGFCWLLTLTCLSITACGSSSSADAPPFHCPGKSLGERQAALASLNVNPDSGSELVPGHPDRLLLCRYRGLNAGGMSLRLAATRLLQEPSKVGRYAAVIDGLPPWPEGEYNCPEDDGARTLAFFGYKEEAPVVLEISLAGCEGVSNGRAPSAEIGPLGKMLEAELPYPHPKSSEG